MFVEKRVAVTAGVLVVAALGGCTGSSPGPSTTPTTSSSTRSVSPSQTSTSASPSPTASLPSDLPPAARKQTIEGGVEFAKWFVAKTSEAYATWDTRWLAVVAAPDCNMCTLFASTIEGYKQRGERVDRVSYQFTGSQVAPGEKVPEFTVDVLGVDRPSRLLGKDGQVKASYGEQRSWLRATVRWAGDRWRLVTLKAVMS